MSLLERLKQVADRLKTEIALLAVVYRDPHTPWYARAVIFFVVAHTLSPIDLIPDFIPVLGYLDDLVIVPLGIALAVRLVPKEVFNEARAKVDSQPEITGISGWWFGGPVIIIWILIFGYILNLVSKQNWFIR